MQFEQTGQFGRQRKIQLLDDRALRIREKQKKYRREYSVDLLALDAQSHSRIVLCWPWLLASLLSLGGVLFLLWWLPHYLPGHADGYLLLTLVLGSMLISGQLYLFWKYSSRKRYFVSRHAKIPLLELQMNQPSSNEFGQFVKHLEQRIARLDEHFELSTQQQLSGELRMLRRLVKSKVLKQEEYKRAKAKLFGRFDGADSSQTVPGGQLSDLADA